MPAKGKSIEVDEDLDFQQREWTLERIGWIAMAVIVLLSLIGLFGDGPISQSTIGEEGGFEFTYGRFARNNSPSEIQVSIPESLIQEGQASFWIDQNYLEGIQIENIFPEPEDTLLYSDRITYTFATGNSAFPFEVKFDITTESIGINNGKAGTANGQQVQFTQVVYP